MQCLISMSLLNIAGASKGYNNEIDELTFAVVRRLHFVCCHLRRFATVLVVVPCHRVSVFILRTSGS